MPVPRSSHGDGSGTALGVGVRTKLSMVKGVMSTGFDFFVTRGGRPFLRRPLSFERLGAAKREPV
jgi:hypothetical protein